MKESLQKTKSDSGFVILFAVVFSSILLAVSLGVSSIAFKEISFTTSARETNRAFLAADTGVECVLYNDKIGSFIQNVSQPDITCAGATFDVVFTTVNSYPTWSFTIPPEPGNPNQTQCSKVVVTKDNNLYYDRLDIVSKGYNTGGSSCDQGFNRVERQLNVSYTTGAIVAADDFSEAADVILSSHQPTGANAGSGWVVHLADPNLFVNTNGKVVENFSGNGSWYKMNNNLGSDQMDVEADFTSSANAREDVYFGLLGRLPVSVDNTNSVRTYYRYNYGGGDGAWVLEDGSSSATSYGSWPGGIVNMRLEIRTGSTKLYVNGVQKLSINNPQFSGQKYAGIIVGNTTGVSGKVNIDDYLSVGF
jgi:hypothetical protein